MRNRIGPRIVPRGTPDLTIDQSEYVPRMATRCWRLVRKLSAKSEGGRRCRSSLCLVVSVYGARFEGFRQLQECRVGWFGSVCCCRPVVVAGE